MSTITESSHLNQSLHTSTEAARNAPLVWKTENWQIKVVDDRIEMTNRVGKKHIYRPSEVFFGNCDLEEYCQKKRMTLATVLDKVKDVAFSGSTPIFSSNVIEWDEIGPREIEPVTLDHGSVSSRGRFFEEVCAALEASGLLEREGP